MLGRIGRSVVCGGGWRFNGGRLNRVLLSWVFSGLGQLVSRAHGWASRARCAAAFCAWQRDVMHLGSSPPAPRPPAVTPIALRSRNRCVAVAGDGAQAKGRDEPQVQAEVQAGVQASAPAQARSSERLRTFLKHRLEWDEQGLLPGNFFFPEEYAMPSDLWGEV